jgi:hypothetical protein
LQAIFVLATLILFAPASGASEEDAVEWTRYAEEGTIKVITANQDGSPRETKIWLAVVDGQGYIRTGNTRWGGNVERNPEVTLLIGETELPLRVEFVTDESERDAVKAAFREKYGFSDRILDPIRGKNPKIMRLIPRDPQ